MKTTAPLSSRQPVTRLELERFFSGVCIQLGQTDMGLAHGSSPVRVSEVKKFFSEIRHKVESRQHRLDKKQATGFNVFYFIQPDENRLSDVLAWLLDPKGSHGQNDLFLRLIFKQLELGTNETFTVDTRVLREAPTHGIEKYRRRMDVLVEAGAYLVIENKVDSSEQSEQVKDYLEHLHRCAGGRKTALIYLTPNGRQPDSLGHESLMKHKKTGQLHCWSYHVELRCWLEICLRECEAQRIKVFLKDFIGYIESKLKREFKDEQERNGDEN